MKNEHELPKVSFVQLAMIITVCRLFTLMTRIPLIRDGFSCAEQLMAAAISAAAAAVLIIPSVIFYRRHDTGIIDSIYGRSRAWGTISAAFYIVYILWACVTDITDFTAFIGSRFDFGAEGTVISLMLIIVCIYCAYCGAEGICRSSGAVLVMFLIMAAFLVYGSCERASAENIRCGMGRSNTLSAVLDDLSGSTELIMLCLMGKFTRDRYRCGAYFSLTGRLILSVGITFGALLVLGDYAYICSYPLLDTGSAAGIRFLQRIDAVYMIVWSLSAVLTLSLKIFLAADILRTIFPKKLPMMTIFSAAAYILSALSLTAGRGVMLVLMAVCLLVPLLVKSE